jgi:hypothetical protein
VKALNFFNLRTFLVLAGSQLATWLTLQYNLEVRINLLLFGIFLGFPLHFALQTAFRRRERALEYFSKFKGSLIAVHYCFQSAGDLLPERKVYSLELLRSTAKQLVQQLESRVSGYKDFQAKLDEVFHFVLQNHEEIGGRTIKRIIRHLADTAETSAYLVSLVTHRTVAGLRVYMTIFIFLLPFIQAPLTFHRLEGALPLWGYYAFMGLASLTLVTLANFQGMLEYPFDPKGLDNIKAREFLLETEVIEVAPPATPGQADPRKK